MPIDDLCPSLNKYYIPRHKNSTSCTLFHQSNVLGNKAAVNFPESHPISHCKPELDQKAGILAWEERQLERNSKPTRFSEYPLFDQPRGLKSSMAKFKQSFYELSCERMEMVKFTLQKITKHQRARAVFLKKKTPGFSPGTHQDRLWNHWNLSETVPIKGLRQGNLFSGYLNVIWTAPDQQKVFKALCLFTFFPSSRHPPKRGVFVLWLLKAICGSVGQRKIKTSGSLGKGLPPFWKRLQLVKLLSLLSLWLNHARALLSMWNHD